MKISQIIIEQANNIPHLYLDMDGVFVNFDRDFKKFDNDIRKLANSDPKTIYDFFVNLKPLPDGMKLIQWLKQHKIPFTILSAPLRSTKTSNEGASASLQAKIDWIKKYFPDLASTAKFTSAKHKYAAPNTVLVDDKPTYVNPFVDAGGMGVVYTDFNNAVQQLSKIYNLPEQSLIEDPTLLGSKPKRNPKYLGPTEKVKSISPVLGNTKRKMQVPLNKKGFGGS
jgi:5'(3')-deoxyribonucleotidase